jgi:hypothetical protein
MLASRDRSSAPLRSRCPVCNRLRRRRVLRTRAKRTNGEHSTGPLPKLVAVGAVTDTVGRCAVTAHGIDVLLRLRDQRRIGPLWRSAATSHRRREDLGRAGADLPVRASHLRGRARTRNTLASNDSRNARSLQCAGCQELRRGAQHGAGGGRCCQAIEPHVGVERNSMRVRFINLRRYGGATDRRRIAFIQHGIEPERCGAGNAGFGSFGNRLRNRRGDRWLARAVPSCQPDTWAFLRSADAGCGRRPGNPGGEIGVLELSATTRIASLMKGR